MSWTHIARKDFEDAVRSLLLAALTGLLILLVAGLAAIPYLLATNGEAPDYQAALAFLFSPIGLLVPIIGLIVGYQAIVRERESGTIRFLLGLPNTRLDVIVGKTIGRAAVVAIPTLLGFVVGGIVIIALYDGFDVLDYLGLFGFSVLMGLVYVAIAVGISASVDSRAKAVGAVVSIYVLFDVIWSTIPLAIYWALNRELAFESVPAWYIFIERLSPGQALTAVALDLVDFLGAGEVDLTAAGRIDGAIPFYVETWVSWLVIAAWILIPLGIGYYRFKRAILS